MHIQFTTDMGTVVTVPAETIGLRATKLTTNGRQTTRYLVDIVGDDTAYEVSEKEYRELVGILDDITEGCVRRTSRTAK